MKRRYYIRYIDSDGAMKSKVTPLYIYAQHIAREMSNVHGNAQIGCNVPNFRARWYKHGKEIA